MTKRPLVHVRCSQSPIRVRELGRADQVDLAPCPACAARTICPASSGGQSAVAIPAQGPYLAITPTVRAGVRVGFALRTCILVCLRPSGGAVLHIPGTEEPRFEHSRWHGDMRVIYSAQPSTGCG